MIRFVKSLQFIFQPDFWHRNYPTSRNYNITLNRLLDKGVKFTNIDIEKGYADLGDTLNTLKRIHIASYPYAFCCYTVGVDTKRNIPETTYMPSRLTCKRVKKVLELQGVDV